MVDYERIVGEVFELDEAQRAQLWLRLDEDLHPPGDEVVPEERRSRWRAELERRREEVRSGEPGIDADDVLSRLQAKLDATSS